MALLANPVPRMFHGKHRGMGCSLFHVKQASPALRGPVSCPHSAAQAPPRARGCGLAVLGAIKKQGVEPANQANQLRYGPNCQQGARHIGVSGAAGVMANHQPLIRHGEDNFGRHHEPW